MAQLQAIELASLSKLDTNSFVPLYMQIADQFAEIINGSRDVLSGAALPSEAELVEFFGVSRPTVRQAMAQLLVQNLITRGRGRGTFVAPERIDHDLSRTFEDQIRQANRSVRFKVLNRITELPPKNIRKALRLGENQKVECIRRIRLLEGEVFAYEERYIEAEYASMISKAALETQALYSLICEYAKEPPTSFSLTTRSISASGEAAKILGVEQGAPFLWSEHTYFLASGKPILHGVALFRGDRYQFSISTQIKADHPEARGA